MPLKASEINEEEAQEEISVDAAVAAVLAEPGGIFTLKERRRGFSLW